MRIIVIFFAVTIFTTVLNVAAARLLLEDNWKKWVVKISLVPPIAVLIILGIYVRYCLSAIYIMVKEIWEER